VEKGEIKREDWRVEVVIEEWRVVRGEGRVGDGSGKGG